MQRLHEPGTQEYTQHILYELADSVRERDLITYEHSRRVAVYANRLAKALGWSRRARRNLALAALVHDLGKTWLRNHVLHKTTRPEGDEWSEVERHPVIAARFLESYDAPDDIIEAARHHHEAYDGSGYPDRLCGEAIPEGARILTVADVFDALTSARPYKDAMPLAEARARLLAGRGRSFDPAIVDAFVALLDADPDFMLEPRVCPLPLWPAPSPAWVRHDTPEM